MMQLSLFVYKSPRTEDQESSPETSLSLCHADVHQQECDGDVTRNSLALVVLER